VIRAAALLLLLVGSSGCGQFPAPTPVGTRPPQTIVLAPRERLTTSTPVAPPSPTVATATEGPRPSATETAGARDEGTATPLLHSPTPELRLTRTMVPSTTPVPPLPIAPTPPRAALSPSPTRTVGRSPVPTIGVIQKPFDTPALRAPHFDLAHARTISPGADAPGVVLAPGQTNVHRFDVTAAEGTITVNLTGRDIELYQTTLISPGGAQAGFGMPIGTLGRQIRAPIRGQTGTWYVEVTVDRRQARTPSREYTIRADVRAGTPTAE
jgi:hypothetical protein